MKVFAQRLKELREEKELSQSKISKIVGVGQTSISELEMGNRIPNADTLIKLADFFGCTIDYLVGRVDY